jgi:hypothetical protein
MKFIPILVAACGFCAFSLKAGELDQIAKQLVTASLKNDAAAFEKIYTESPTKQKAIADFAKEFVQAAPLIDAGKLKVTAIDKELVIGDLGVTLMRLDFADQPKASFRPIVCVRVSGSWEVFPWSSTSDLKVLSEMRTPEEKIHIQLFNKWANLMEDLLLEQEDKKGNANQPATRPDSKPEGDEKPAPESKEHSR